MKTYSEARARLRWYQGRYIDLTVGMVTNVQI